MDTQTFIYNDKEREVVVLEETATTISGIDLTKSPHRTKIKEAIKPLEKGEDGLLKEEDFNVIKPYFKDCYRKFLKAKITQKK